jgi:hypothetical protein
VDNDSGLSRFAFHIPPESDFSISRNPYSPFPGTPIHMPRIPQLGACVEKIGTPAAAAKPISMDPD